MKKINLLIPAITTSSVACLTALTGCVVHNPDEPKQTPFELTEYYSYEVKTKNYLIEGLQTKQLLDLEKATMYTALINLKNFPITNKADCDLAFFVSTDVKREEAAYAEILTAEVKVDNTPLRQVYIKEDLQVGRYYIENNENISSVLIGPGTLRSTSIVEISFTIEQSVKQYYLVSQIVQILSA